MDAALLTNIAAGAAFALFWLFSFFILYHLTRFGIGILPKRVAALFLVGAVILFSACLILFVSTDLRTLSL